MKGFTGNGIDELQSFIGQYIGSESVHTSCLTFNFEGRVSGRRASAQETCKMLETQPGGVVLGIRPQMPFADQGGMVPGI